MLKNCSFCDSDKIAQSKTYPDMWFCQSCGKGDYISKIGTLNIKELTIADDLRNFKISGIIKSSQHKKTLIICSGVLLNHYLQVYYGSLVFVREVDAKSIEYYTIENKKEGLYLFNSNAPEWLISDDFKNLSFDQIIMISPSREDRDHTVNHLRNCYQINQIEKSTELFIFN